MTFISNDTSIEYRPTLDWYIDRVLTDYWVLHRSSIWLWTECRPWPSVDQLLIDTRWIVGEVLVKYRRTKSYIGRLIHRQIYRPTVDQVSIDSRPTVDRLLTDISVDYRSIADRYIDWYIGRCIGRECRSKHDPNFFRLVMYVGQRKILIACKESNIRPSDSNKKDGKF